MTFYSRTNRESEEQKKAKMIKALIRTIQRRLLSCCHILFTVVLVTVGLARRLFLRLYDKFIIANFKITFCSYGEIFLTLHIESFYFLFYTWFKLMSFQNTLSKIIENNLILQQLLLNYWLSSYKRTGIKCLHTKFHNG